MIDFAKHTSIKKGIEAGNLISLFKSLDRQASHTELRPSQMNVCEELFTRRESRDLILKMSTGSGKSTIGLLYLESMMRELDEPVVYLCPKKQLIKQVLKEAEKLGIKAYEYPAKMTFPPSECTSGDAILVCTYNKLFNARNTFSRNDVQLNPHAIVLDDVHSGIEEIMKSFTISIQRNLGYNAISDLLNTPCQKYNRALWIRLREMDPAIIFEVPFWIWKTLKDEICDILTNKVDPDELSFVWPKMLEHLDSCRCVISSQAIEIIPDIIPVEMVMPYNESSHRLAMSATLSDDSVLVRELAFSVDAALSPIIPKDDFGLGEKMILVPTLFDQELNRQWVMRKCAKIAQKFNVVVLSHSEKKAKEWETEGAIVRMRDEVEQTVADLNDKSNVGNFYVFVQRYDGIDLPDAACRILIIDGLPHGESIVDKYDSSSKRIPGGTRHRLIYRLEQGMGRAVRSRADYAIIILVGDDLAHFISRGNVRSTMNFETKSQIELALSLARLSKEETEESPEDVLLDLIRKALRRDPGWKQYYDENVRQQKPIPASKQADSLNLADIERKAFNLYLNNQSIRAQKTLTNFIDTLEL